MILAVDVDYREDGSAIAAGLAFKDWTSYEIEGAYIVKVDKILPYEPGSFFKRELPCILQLIKSLEFAPEIIVIDGYVTLGKDNKKGLGAHLYQALNENIPVIGVAKNKFKDTPSECNVYRGRSMKPLYVTSAGIDNIKAMSLIQQMHGNSRIPTLLKQVDRSCRDAIM